MIAYRRSVDEEARALKDSHLALERMAKLYRKFDGDERRMADRVLGEWVMSEDRDLRFDALWIIDEMNVMKY